MVVVLVQVVVAPADQVQLAPLQVQVVEVLEVQVQLEAVQEQVVEAPEVQVQLVRELVPGQAPVVGVQADQVQPALALAWAPVLVVRAQARVVWLPLE